MTVAYMANQEYVTFDNTIIVNTLGKQRKHTNFDAVYELLRTFKYKDITKEFLKKRVNEPIMQEKIRISSIETKTLTSQWKLGILSHLLKKPLMQNFIFCVVSRSHLQFKCSFKQIVTRYAYPESDIFYWL